MASENCRMAWQNYLTDAVEWDSLNINTSSPDLNRGSSISNLGLFLSNESSTTFNIDKFGDTSHQSFNHLALDPDLLLLQGNDDELGAVPRDFVASLAASSGVVENAQNGPPRSGLPGGSERAYAKQNAVVSREALVEARPRSRRMHHVDDASSGTRVHKKHRCSLCGKAFRYPKDLRRHGLTHGTDEGGNHYCPYVECDYAVRGFQRRDTLMRHLRNIHSGQARR